MRFEQNPSGIRLSRSARFSSQGCAKAHNAHHTVCKAPQPVLSIPLPLAFQGILKISKVPG